VPFVPQTGIWAHTHWAPGGSATVGAPIAYLRASEPIDSLRSSYTLWLMDRDGSNGRQIFPLPGEISRFPREAHFMTWGPAGEDMAFIFNDSLYLYNLATADPFRITQDEGNLSHPTWAPYGAGIGSTLPTTAIVPIEDLDPAEGKLIDDAPLPTSE
jgi:Tol biopolymer transport system component